MDRSLLLRWHLGRLGCEQARLVDSKGGISTRVAEMAGTIAAQRQWETRNIWRCRLGHSQVRLASARTYTRHAGVRRRFLVPANL
jgi:hypothetical protein